MINFGRSCERTNRAINRGFASSGSRNDAYMYVKYIIRSDCPDCAYDPVTKTSTNIACQTCGGIGKVIDIRTAVVNGTLNYMYENDVLDSGGVVAKDSVKYTMSNGVYLRYKTYLKPKHRVYVGSSSGIGALQAYEINQVGTYGYGPNCMITLTLEKVVEAKEGKE